MLNLVHSVVLTAELIVLGSLALTRNVSLLVNLIDPFYKMVGMNGLAPLLVAADTTQDCYQVLSIFMFQLAILNLLMAKDLDFVVSTLVSRAILVYLIMPASILVGPVPHEAWLYVVLEGLQVLFLYISTNDAIERGVRSIKADPSFSTIPSRMAAVTTLGLGGSLVLQQAWYLIYPLDYLANAVGLEKLSTLFLNPHVIPMAALCAQPVANLGFLYIWNDQNPRFLRFSVYLRILFSGVVLPLLVFLNAGIPDSMYVFSIYDVVGAIYTQIYLFKRVPYKRA